MADLQVLGTLRNFTGTGTIAYADQIKDTDTGKFLSEINQELLNKSGSTSVVEISEYMSGGIHLLDPLPLEGIFTYNGFPLSEYVSLEDGPASCSTYFCIRREDVPFEGMYIVFTGSNKNSLYFSTFYDVDEAPDDIKAFFNNNEASRSRKGLMSAEDKTKLDKALTSIDVTLSTLSTNPVQNKVITNTLNEKVDKSYIKTALDAKQDTLVSGVNIKTINGISLLGAGDAQFEAKVNLFTNSGFNKASNNTYAWSFGVTGDYSISSIEDNVKGLTIQYKESSEDGEISIYQRITTEANHYYVLSFWIKGTGSVNLTECSLFESDNLADPSNTSDVDYFIIDGTLVSLQDFYLGDGILTTEGRHYIYFYKKKTTTDYIEFNLQVEQGNSLTFYKPMLMRSQDVKLQWVLNNEDIYATQLDITSYINPNDYYTKTQVDTKLPKNVSELTNDSGYLVASDISGKADKSDVGDKNDIQFPSNNIVDAVNQLNTNKVAVNDLTAMYYSKLLVDNIIQNINLMDMKVVQELPTTDISTTSIYLVPKDVEGALNIYDEYVYVDSNWEKVGDTEIDLSDYVKAETLSKVATSGKLEDVDGNAPYTYSISLGKDSELSTLITRKGFKNTAKTYNKESSLSTIDTIVEFAGGGQILDISDVYSSENKVTGNQLSSSGEIHTYREEYSDNTSKKNSITISPTSINLQSKEGTIQGENPAIIVDGENILDTITNKADNSKDTEYTASLLFELFPYLDFAIATPITIGDITITEERLKKGNWETQAYISYITTSIETLTGGAIGVISSSYRLILSCATKCTISITALSLNAATPIYKNGELTEITIPAGDLPTKENYNTVTIDIEAGDVLSITPNGSLFIDSFSIPSEIWPLVEKISSNLESTKTDVSNITTALTNKVEVSTYNTDLATKADISDLDRYAKLSENNEFTSFNNFTAQTLFAQGINAAAGGNEFAIALGDVDESGYVNPQVLLNLYLEEESNYDGIISSKDLMSTDSEGNIVSLNEISKELDTKVSNIKQLHYTAEDLYTNYDVIYPDLGIVKIKIKDDSDNMLYLNPETLNNKVLEILSTSFTFTTDCKFSLTALAILEDTVLYRNGEATSIVYPVSEVSDSNFTTNTIDVKEGDVITFLGNSLYLNSFTLTYTEESVLDINIIQDDYLDIDALLADTEYTTLKSKLGYFSITCTNPVKIVSDYTYDSMTYSKVLAPAITTSGVNTYLRFKFHAKGVIELKVDGTPKNGNGGFKYSYKGSTWLAKPRIRVNAGENRTTGLREVTVPNQFASFYLLQAKFRVCDTLIQQSKYPTQLSLLDEDSDHKTVTDTEKQTWNNKQNSLVSGTNIKTINNTSIVGSGNVSVGTITGITMNGSSKGTSGVVNLGTVLTSTTSSVTSNSTTPITSGGVYTALLSYLTTTSAASTYEPKLTFTSDSYTSFTASRNTYYRLTNTPTSLSITLPSSSLTAGDLCAFSFTTGSSISFSISGGTIYKQDGFSIEKSSTYEVVALYDGAKWLVTATKFTT